MISEKYSNNEEILIVEDSPTQAETLKFFLEKHNYHVSVAHNGKEALTLVNKHKPTIVISDIIMPEMDGYQLCRRIKDNKNLKDIPVILLTALSDPKDVLKGLECGADNFITKPYEERYLISRVHYILANRALHETEKMEMGIKIYFGGQEYYITAERQQILNLLLSTYETAVQKNVELLGIQDELKRLNEELEKKVEERTADLKAEIETRKHAEEVLRKSEERLKLAQKIGSIGDWEYDVVNNKITWSDEVFELYERDPALGNPSIEEEAGYYSPEQVKVLRDYAAKAIQKGESFEYDIELNLPKKGRVYVHATKHPLKDEKGNVYKLIGTVQDITERKKAEQELKERLNELERFHKATVDRELRMVELKKEIKDLKEEIKRLKEQRK